MSSEEIVIDVRNLSKRYEIYAAPRDRLKQMVLPRLYRAVALVGHVFGSRYGNISPQYFREFWALRNVSFQVRRGETMGIVGRNGSGKSTLLQLICGTLAPTHGEVSVKGRISALLELGSGFNPEYTGCENIFLNGQILGLSRSEIEDRYDAIVEFADIGDFIDQPVKTYSSGMSVRLAFAVAINVDPEILVIDEALAVGDVGFQARCFAKINELRTRGVTLLFVSHSAGAITELCGRAVLIDGGELLLHGTSYQAIRAYNYLASAGHANFKEVRKEVVDMVETENEAFAGASHEKMLETLAVSADSRKSSAVTKEMTTSLEAHFDRQLCQAVRPLPFERRGAVIENISVTDLVGQNVNVLPMHQEFILEFDVRFDAAFDHVRFAWVINTASGTILGGGTTHQSGAGISVRPASSIHVTSHFSNYFMPGNYLIDVGVRGKLEVEDEFLHGISNAVGIRSVSNFSNLRRGFVDCLVSPAFTLVDDDGQTIPI